MATCTNCAPGRPCDYHRSPIAEPVIRPTMGERQTYTAADYARDVSRIAVRVTGEVHNFVQGAWNPNHNAADASFSAKSFCADLRSLIEHIENRALAAQGDVGAAQLPGETK